MRKNILLLILFLGTGNFLVFAQGQTPGTTALPFLKIGFSARPQALGGNFVALSDDVSAFEYNPAGLANLKGSQYNFTHMALFDNDVTADVFMSGVGFGNNAIGFSAKVLKVKDYTTAKTDVAGVETIVQTTGLELSDSNFSFLYARNFPVSEYNSSEIKFGFTANSIIEKLDTGQVSALSADLGLLYLSRSTGNRWGVSVANVGSVSGSQVLPMTLRIGTGFTSKEFNTSIDAVQAIDSKVKFGIGLEIPLQKVFILRFGGSYQQSLDFSAGFGFDFKYVKIDYAYTPHADLGTSTRISLLIDFTPKPEHFYFGKQ
ncbi:MAG: PorV/PorQ family protein [Elusimicrobia bacterium]|nr:PorV/PorQ family protein [Elusimicrobiota bacterium]